MPEVYSPIHMALSQERRQKLGLSSVFFTYFIDALSWAIVFPIFAPFFLDMNNHLFAPTVSIETRTVMLGVFFAVFSLGQFMGAPILGEYADLRGRKKTLSISIFFTFVGLALSAWSQRGENIYLLFVGRILTGVFAGNMSICLACVADLCPDEKERVQKFGKLAMMSGIAFVLGGYLGGQLSDPTVSSFFFPSLPLWCAAGLTFINWLCVLFALPETAPEHKDEKFSLQRYFSNVRIALSQNNIKSMYAIYFLFLFAWTLILQFVPILMVRNFQFTNSNLGDLTLFMGACWVFSSGFLNKWVVHYVSSYKIMEVCLLCFTVLCIPIIFPLSLHMIYILLACSVLVGGLAWPHCNGMISKAAPPKMQGNFMGMSQSLQSLSMGIAPAVGGVAYQVFSGFPFLLGALASLLAGILYFCLHARQKL